MARIRSIKPEFWDDRRLARSTSRDARLLYIGLWNQADEHARCNGDLEWIKGRVFPYETDLDGEEIAGLLLELAQGGWVEPYTVQGDPFLFLPKLNRHQRLEPEKVASRLPSPDEADAPPSVDELRSRANECASRADNLARDADESERDADSYFDPHGGLMNAPDPGQNGHVEAADGGRVSGQAAGDENDDSPAATDCADEYARRSDESALLYVAGGMEHVAGNPPTPHGGKRGSRRASGDDPDFERFWDAYPAKRDKGHARKAWAKAIRHGTDPEAIIAGAEHYRDDPTRKPDYTAYPATWLNGERWNDAPVERSRVHAVANTPFWEN